MIAIFLCFLSYLLIKFLAIYLVSLLSLYVDGSGEHPLSVSNWNEDKHRQCKRSNYADKYLTKETDAYIPSEVFVMKAKLIADSADRESESHGYAAISAEVVTAEAHLPHMSTCIWSTNPKWNDFIT